MSAFDVFASEDGASLLDALAEEPSWQPIEELMMCRLEDEGANNLNDAAFAAVTVVAHRLSDYEVSARATGILANLPIVDDGVRQEAIEVVQLLAKKFWLPGSRKDALARIREALTR